jgi:SOS response regulatory protein OraA/RecX
MEISWVQEIGIPKRIEILVEGEQRKMVSNAIVHVRDLEGIKKDEKFFENLHAIEVKGAIRYALFCLSRQALHSKKLEKALQRHLLDPDVIATVIDYCRKYGLLDDEEWTQNKIRKWQSQGKSTADVKARLRKAGVGVEGVGCDDLASLELLVARKYSQLLSAKTPYKERMRVLQALQRRGFSFGMMQEFLQKKKNNIMMSQETEGGFCKTRDRDMRSAGEGESFDLDETHSGGYE